MCMCVSSSYTCIIRKMSRSLVRFGEVSANASIRLKDVSLRTYLYTFAHSNLYRLQYFVKHIADCVKSIVW